MHSTVTSEEDNVQGKDACWSIILEIIKLSYKEFEGFHPQN